MNEILKIKSEYVNLLDQIFEIERKLEKIKEPNNINRHINKMKNIFENILSTPSKSDVGLFYHNPIDEDYNETRTDLDASIAGESTKNLVVTEVIKPIIRFKDNTHTRITRKGVVVVESKMI